MKALPAPTGTLECPRCGSDNRPWENLHNAKFLDFLNRIGGLMFIPIAIIAIELFFAPYFIFEDGVLAPFALLVVILLMVLSVFLAWRCYSWRFRIHEETLLGQIVITPRRFPAIRLLQRTPVFVLLLIMVIYGLAVVASGQFAQAPSPTPTAVAAATAAPTPKVSPTPAPTAVPAPTPAPTIPPTPTSAEIVVNAIVTPSRPVLALFVYAFLAACVFPATAVVVKHYTDSFDLPQPIFLDVPLMRRVATEEYLGQHLDTAKLRNIEYFEITRTSQGGLSMLVSQRVEDRIRKFKIECDQWARLVSAKDADKPY